MSDRPDNDPPSPPSRGGPLAIASAHVSQAWFPPAPSVANAVREKIIQNRYRSFGEEILADVKQDFSLFTHCVRELVTLAETRGDPIAKTSPLHLLEQASTDDIISIVNRSPQKLDLFLANRASPEQRATLTTPIISAAICEQIAVHRGFQSETAYSLALLRSLGLTLIAWNYPTVFHRTLRTLRGDHTLDRALSRMLGFSPSLLGLTVASQWHISDDIHAGLGDTAYSKEREQPHLGELVSICKIGEALARVNLPWHQPDAAHKYIGAVEELKTLFGREGMRQLQKTLSTHCSLLIDALPDFLRADDTDADESIEAYLESGDLSPQFTTIREEIVKRLARNESTEELLRFVQSSVFPATEFRSGCVYLLDPTEHTLTPRLAFGQIGLSTFERISLTAPKVIARGFAKRQPLIESPASKDRGDSGAETLTAQLGAEAPIGVLSLQAKNTSQGKERVLLRSFAEFRAILELVLAAPT